MRRVLVIGAATLLAACGGAADAPSFSALVERPADFDGESITIESGYYGAFEVSVLTSGFAESFPPQPVEPLIWVGASPEGECLQDAGGMASFAERVEATGTFRYDPDKGFGHLGAYDMTLEDARLTCL